MEPCGGTEPPCWWVGLLGLLGLLEAAQAACSGSGCSGSLLGGSMALNLSLPAVLKIAIEMPIYPDCSIENAEMVENCP